MASMGGRTVLWGSLLLLLLLLLLLVPLLLLLLLLVGERECLSALEAEPLRLRGWVRVGAGLCLSESSEDGPMDSLSGDFWCVLRDESLEGRAKDCSKGLGSRSNVDRLGRGGGSRSWCWVVGEGDCSSWCGCCCGMAVIVVRVSSDDSERTADRFSPLEIMTASDVISFHSPLFFDSLALLHKHALPAFSVLSLPRRPIPDRPSPGMCPWSGSVCAYV